jgi:hypothetical protein
MNEPTAFHRFYYRRVATWPEPVRLEARTRIAEAFLDVSCCARPRDIEPILRDLEGILANLERQFLQVA